MNRNGIHHYFHTIISDFSDILDSFIKLRELSVGYTLPQAWLNKQTLIKGVTLSLVGRNLWTILKHTDNIDPESAYNNGNAQGLELNGYPATRNVGFNVNVKF